MRRCDEKENSHEIQSNLRLILALVAPEGEDHVDKTTAQNVHLLLARALHLDGQHLEALDHADMAEDNFAAKYISLSASLSIFRDQNAPK